VLKTLLVLYI